MVVIEITRWVNDRLSTKTIKVSPKTFLKRYTSLDKFDFGNGINSLFIHIDNEYFHALGVLERSSIFPRIYNILTSGLNEMLNDIRTYIIETYGDKK